MNYHCFRCGKELSNEVSVQLGIGPICRGKIRKEEKVEERQRKENLQCHHGFTCYNPGHAATTIGRFWRIFEIIARQVPLSDEITTTAQGLVAQIYDALGLGKDPIQMPEIEVPAFGADTIFTLGISATKGPGGGRSYAMPVDHDRQYRHIQLRQMGICPFGLDCQEPNKAVTAVWQLLSIMRYEVEPRLNTETGCGWAWDSRIYGGLANTLEVLGFDEDAREIEEIARQQREKPRRLAMFDLALAV